MKKHWFIIPLATLCLTGCSTLRNTTTAQTAIEQALLARSLHCAIEQFATLPLKERTFFLDTSLIEVKTHPYLTELKQFLLSQGLRAAVKEEDANLMVLPRPIYRAIDDARFFIGIPMIPLPVPAVGTVQIPEFALFRSENQMGRCEIAFSIYERATGRLLHDQPPVTGQRYYDRYTVLFLVSFRLSNLGPPF